MHSQGKTKQADYRTCFPIICEASFWRCRLKPRQLAMRLLVPGHSDLLQAIGAMS